MTASSPRLPDPNCSDSVVNTISYEEGNFALDCDVSKTVEGDEETGAQVVSGDSTVAEIVNQDQGNNVSSALATRKGNFSEFLAPLKQDTFKQVVRDVESKLQVVNQTLSMLDNLMDAQGFDAIL